MYNERNGGRSMKTAVVLDSGSNYYNEDIDIPGLYAIPLQLIDGETAYKESVEISIREINKKMMNGIRIQTSLPVLGEIESLFRQIKEDGYDQIFAVPITSGISGTLEAMVSAANIVEIDFNYIDCYTTMHTQLYIGIQARKLINEGKSVDETKSLLQNVVNHSNTFIIPDNLEHLSQGGRLSPLAAKLGGLLRIKPILHLDKSTNGVIDPFDKVRTMNGALDRVVKAFQEEGVDDTYHITITHVENRKDAEIMAEKLKAVYPDNKITIDDLISTVSAHVGIGTIALQYYKTV